VTARIDLFVKAHKAVVLPSTLPGVAPRSPDARAGAQQERERAERQRDLEERVQRWKEITEAGGVDAWLKAQLLKKGFSADAADPASLTDRQRAQFKAQKKAEGEQQKAQTRQTAQQQASQKRAEGNQNAAQKEAEGRAQADQKKAEGAAEKARLEAEANAKKDDGGILGAIGHAISSAFSARCDWIHTFGWRRAMSPAPACWASSKNGSRRSPTKSAR